MSGFDRRHPSNLANLIEFNRKARMAALLARIAEIDPSARPVPACPDCDTGFAYGDFGCPHPVPADVLTANAAAFAERYELVFACIHAAIQLGYPAGFQLDPNEPGWPVAFIELPTGQVSWHMPAHPNPYDGHSVAEKYARIGDYGSSVTG